MVRRFLKRVLPPVVTDAIRWARARFGAYGRPEWEYVPEGWQLRDPNVKGWDVESVARTKAEDFRALRGRLQGTGPLGVENPERLPTERDYAASNTLMCYAYVLALAARRKERISLLDWGGGVGHYLLISRALLPGVEIDYHCKDLPGICAEGRRLLPEARFYDDEEECFRRTYDLVLASASLHYSQDWKRTLSRLAAAARPHLFVTRLPTVRRVPSFVVLQRPYPYGYDTEYLGWFLNRDEFLAAAATSGLSLVREFLIDERPTVHRAPEQPDTRGFLFRSRDALPAKETPEPHT